MTTGQAASANAIRYRWTLLRAGEFRLDAGTMFGVIPRVVWSRTCSPDDRNRLPVNHNCLLLERIGDAPANAKLPSPKLILIEAGTGDKLDAKSRDLFALQDRTILNALHEVNCDPKDIGAAVITHLHFDHAGGLSRLSRPGETPDWTGPASSFGAPRGDIACKRTFPNAAVFVQRREWNDAIANRSTMTRTYFSDHLEVIREQLKLVDSSRAFPLGATPDRTDVPSVPQHARETEIMPGVFVFLTPGHTWGQQAVRFVDDQGHHIVFTPDVLPTAWHVGAAYSIGYDVEPYTTMISKTWFLAEAAERDWVLCLDHEPGPEPMRRVRRNDKGWYDLVPM